VTPAGVLVRPPVEEDRVRDIAEGPPVQSSVAGHDPPQRVHVGAQILDALGQLRPRVPDRAQQLAGDAVAGDRAQEHGELGAPPQGHPATAALRERLLIDVLPHPLGTGTQKLVHHARVQRPRRDRIDIDAVRAQLLRQRLGEAHDAGLGGRVGAEPGQWLGGPSARELDDLAMAAFGEVGHQLACEQHRAEQVDLHGPRPLQPVRLIDPALRAIHSGIGDEDRHLSQTAQRELHQPVHVCGAGHVGHSAQHLLIASSPPAKLGESALQRHGIAPADADAAHPLVEIRAGDLQTQPLTGSRDQRGAPGHGVAHR
jgi:hypothetical protein